LAQILQEETWSFPGKSQRGCNWYV